MSSEEWFLREDVYVDPLVNSWYAWPNLIAPVTYAMYMSKTHRRLMTSFVHNHELHLAGSKDAVLAGGGEFVACSKEQVAQVQALLGHYERECSQYYQLADAIKQLDALTRTHSSGESMEPLYERVPEMLKGYVELFMDLYHQPSYRLIEGLLYRSAYYRKGLQAVQFGVLDGINERPFVLSTPRIADGTALRLQRPFDSPVWDRIFRARQEPVAAAEIRALFDANDCTGELPLDAMYTTEPPRSRYEPVLSGVRMLYTGHAGFLIESPDCAILIDPVIAYRTRQNAEEVISYSDLPARIDYICITHNHSDHVNIESLLQLRYKVGTVLVPKNNGGTLADPSLKLILQQLGFRVREMEDLEELELDAGRIVSVPFLGEHGDLNIRSKCAWLLDIAGRRMYFGADSSNLEPRMYEHVRECVGDVDVLAIGMECVGAPYTWLYGALTTEVVNKKIRESRRLDGSNFEKARMMLDAMRAKRVFIYALGLEPWCRYFTGLEYAPGSEQLIQSQKMIDHCNGVGIPVERMFGKYTLYL